METLIYMATSFISFAIAAYILDRDNEEEDRLPTFESKMEEMKKHPHQDNHMD